MFDLRQKERSSQAPGNRARAWSAGLLALIGVLSLTVSVTAASAANTITVTTTAQDGSGGCSLGEAIVSANTNSNAHAPECVAGGAGIDTIELAAGATYTMSAPIDDADNYLGPTATPIVTSEIVLEARGAVIRHSGVLVPFRAFAVDFNGNLTLREVHVKGFEVWGGDGRVGGGGGLGAGGAVFVSLGALTVEYSTFAGNGALGGDGSAGSTVVGGGGGGFGGNGGAPFGGENVRRRWRGRWLARRRRARRCRQLRRWRRRWRGRHRRGRRIR